MQLKWLKEITKSRGMTAEGVARLAKIPYSSYIAYLNGIRNVPVKRAKAIAKVLNFEWWHFYEEPTEKAV